MSGGGGGGGIKHCNTGTDQLQDTKMYMYFTIEKWFCRKRCKYM